MDDHLLVDNEFEGSSLGKTVYLGLMIPQLLIVLGFGPCEVSPSMLSCLWVESLLRSCFGSHVDEMFTGEASLTFLGHTLSQQTPCSLGSYNLSVPSSAMIPKPQAQELCWCIHPLGMDIMWSSVLCVLVGCVLFCHGLHLLQGDASLKTVVLLLTRPFLAEPGPGWQRRQGVEKTLDRECIGQRRQGTTHSYPPRCMASACV